MPVERSASSGESRPAVNASATESGPSREELDLIRALRSGDEATFTTLVSRYNPSLLRTAMMYVHDRSVAEEVVQDTWIGVLRGIDGFEPRASLKTWIFRILVNRAKTSAQREGRTVPFSATWDAQSEPDEPALDPDRFLASDGSYAPAGWWASPPRSWGAAPEDALLAAETRGYLSRAIAALPAAQQEVITLRDVEGLVAGEVCNILGISEINQRVLLHRARAKVRLALERYFTQEP
jgi:RNA polymerase sigma-70 factor (ECF subfamily)